MLAVKCTSSPSERQPVRFADQLVQAPRHDERVFLGGLRQQDHKLVAAVAEREIDQAAGALHDLPDFRQQLGPDQVAVRVVDALEVVEVDEHQRKFVAVALRAVNLRLQNEIHVPRVVQAGAVVGDGQFVNALDVARVFERDGREIRQRLEQRQIALLKSFAPTQLISSITPRQWSRKRTGTATIERVSILVFSSTLEKNRVSWLTSGTITASSCLRHPAGDSLPHLDAHVLQRLRALADGQLEIEFLLGFVHQQQRPGVRTQKLVDFFHDGAQNLIELQGGGERLAQFVENRDFAGFALFSPSR